MKTVHAFAKHIRSCALACLSIANPFSSCEHISRVPSPQIHISNANSRRLSPATCLSTPVRTTDLRSGRPSKSPTSKATAQDTSKAILRTPLSQDRYPREMIPHLPNGFLSPRPFRCTPPTSSHENTPRSPPMPPQLPDAGPNLSGPFAQTRSSAVDFRPRTQGKPPCAACATVALFLLSSVGNSGCLYRAKCLPREFSEGTGLRVVLGHTTYRIWN